MVTLNEWKVPFNKVYSQHVQRQGQNAIERPKSSQKLGLVDDFRKLLGISNIM